MNTGDIRALLIPTAWLLVAALAGVLGLYYTNNGFVEAGRQLAQEQSRLRDARSRLHRAGEEKQVISRNLESYRQLQRLGFVGEERRIDWLDGLRLANEQAGLFGVDYQIGAQRPYPHAAEFDPGQIALSQSPMTLRFRLLHEEDLLRFFNALSRANAGVFSIDECRLKRENAADTVRVQPNLAAECELSWITANPAAVEKKR